MKTVDPFLKLAKASNYDSYVESPLDGIAPFIIEIDKTDAKHALQWARTFFRPPCSFDEAWFAASEVAFFSARMDQESLDQLCKVKAPVKVLGIEYASALLANRTPTVAQNKLKSKPQKLPQTKNTLIGIIDDGCPFARRDLLKVSELSGDTSGGTTCSTRVIGIWDQDLNPAFASRTHTSPPEGWEFGGQVAQAELNALIKEHIDPAGFIDEEATYKTAGYSRLNKRFSHGSFVTGIAAGKGISRSLMPVFGPQTSGGVLPINPPVDQLTEPIENADIAFVQLPRATLQAPTRGALGYAILNGILWMLQIGKDSKTVVVAIDYGSYLGPHDGSSLFERALDFLIESNAPKLQVIFPVGNGFEQKASLWSDRVGSSKKPSVWQWWVPPENEQATFTEIWLGDQNFGSTIREFSMTITAPNGDAVTLRKGGEVKTFTKLSKIFANAYLARDCRSVLLKVNDTKGDEPHTRAPSGRWTFSVFARAGDGNAVNLWAYANRGGRSTNTAQRSYQSRLIPLSKDTVVDGESSIIGMGCSDCSVLVGGVKLMALRRYGADIFKQANSENLLAANYSSAGPGRGGTRMNDGPDYSAVTEESSSLQGISGRGVKSGSSFRLKGTSSGPPQVARLVVMRQTPVISLGRAVGALNEPQFRVGAGVIGLPVVG